MVYVKCKKYLPPEQVVGLDVFWPREFTENNLAIAFNNFFFVNIVLTQQTQGISHVYLLSVEDRRFLTKSVAKGTLKDHLIVAHKPFLFLLGENLKKQYYLNTYDK